MEIVIHEIAKDGLPEMEKLVGRVAFIFDGCIVSGWPLRDDEDDEDDEDGETAWEADSDVGRSEVFYGVTHWIEFPIAVWSMTANAELSGAGTASD